MDANFHSLNSLRSYPLDDAATAVDDAGVELPPNILVDCSLRFPDTMGRIAFLSAVRVTPTLATLLFETASGDLRPSQLDTAAAAGAFQPLGHVSVSLPATPMTSVPIMPAVEGVGGWVVLGTGISTPYAGTFSTPGQGAILPRCAAPEPPLPIPSIGRLGNTTALTGTITLAGASELSVQPAAVAVPSGTAPAAAFSLAGTSTNNPLSEFAGSCGARPESGTCDPPAVERVNDAVPDASGGLQIVFEGADVYPLVGSKGGLVLDLPVSVAELCPGSTAAVDPGTGAISATDDACGDHIYFSAAPPDLTVLSGVFSPGSAGYEAFAAGAICAAYRSRSPSPRLMRVVVRLAGGPASGPVIAGSLFGLYTNDQNQIVYHAAVVDAAAERLVLYEVTAGSSVSLASASLPAAGSLLGAVVELRVAIGESDADLITTTPSDAQIRVTIELDSAVASGRLTASLPRTDGDYGVVSFYSLNTFLELHAEDQASVS